MINNFLVLNYIQPCIVKFKDRDDLPDNVRGMYYIQLNMVNLPFNGSVPAIYIAINKNMFSGSTNNNLGRFFNYYIANGWQKIYEGTSYFSLKTDYYINETMWKWRSSTSTTTTTTTQSPYITSTTTTTTSRPLVKNWTIVAGNNKETGEVEYYVADIDNEAVILGPFPTIKEANDTANEELIDTPVDEEVYDPWIDLSIDTDEDDTNDEILRWDTFETSLGFGFMTFGSDLINTTTTTTIEPSDTITTTVIPSTTYDENGGIKYTTTIYLPDFIENGVFNEDYFDNIFDMNTDFTNLDTFFKLNLMNEFEFTEDNLNSFYKTFCQIILDYNGYYSTNKSEWRTDLTSATNQIYTTVLNYYANGTYDDTSISLQLVMNSMYTVNSNTSSTSCGCNSSSSSSSTVCTPCSELYSSAMETYLKQMLGDSQFYTDWFASTYDHESNGGINIDMCNKILELFAEFIALDYVLEFSTNTNKNCTCQALSNDESECNYKYLNNYIKVINWVKDNNITANKNKIKIYGQQFASLLPELEF